MKSTSKNKKEPAKPTNEDAMLSEPFDQDLKNVGIDGFYLAEKAMDELNAEEIKAQIPKGEKKFVYSKPMIAWDIRQKARQDIHKLKGDYPVEKHEHSVTLEDVLRDIDDEGD